MKRYQPNPWLAIAVAGGILYPPLVYFGMGAVSPTVIVCVALALIGLRLFGLRRQPEAKMWIAAFIGAGVVLIAMLCLNANLAVRAYPIIVSLCVSAIFGLSLWFPPPLVERIARITELDLPPKGIAYTRKVTIVWAVFLLGNAMISAATALWGTLAQWTLWNGLISYILMGVLFLCELAVRKMVRR